MAHENPRIVLAHTAVITTCFTISSHINAYVLIKSYLILNQGHLISQSNKDEKKICCKFTPNDFKCSKNEALTYSTFHPFALLPHL